MTVLAERPGLEQLDLANEIGVDRTTIGDVLVRMERRGLVRRKVSAGDRRAKLVQLTTKGAKIHRAMARAVQRTHDRTLDALPPRNSQGFPPRSRAACRNQQPSRARQNAIALAAASEALERRSQVNKIVSASRFARSLAKLAHNDRHRPTRWPRHRRRLSEPPRLAHRPFRGGQRNRRVRQNLSRRPKQRAQHAFRRRGKAGWRYGHRRGLCRSR